MNDERERLRSRFSEAAELYDRARPSYPPQLVDDLVEIAVLPEGSRVLEIGPGTGQLTIPLAERGLQIDAVELGQDLAGLAARRLARYAGVTVHIARFEDWPLPSKPFDAIMAATAFHWIDPDIRYRKSADSLRGGGTLAIVSTHHVAGGDEGFFDRVQLCYEEHMPGTAPGLRLPRPLEVLMTYSGHRDLELVQRRKLLDCIRDLIDLSYGASINKAYMNQLIVAKKRG